MFKYHHVRHFCCNFVLPLILLFTVTHTQAKETDKSATNPHVSCGLAARAIGSADIVTKGQTAAAATTSTVAKESNQQPPSTEPSNSKQTSTE